MLLWNHFRCFGMFWVLHTLYRRVRRPRRTASNDWYNLTHRGAQCAPTQRQIKRFGSFLAQAPVVLWAHTVRPYDIACADGLHGAPRSYPRAPSLAALPQFTLSHPTGYRSIKNGEWMTVWPILHSDSLRAAFGGCSLDAHCGGCLHFQFSIIYQPNEPNGLENP